MKKTLFILFAALAYVFGAYAQEQKPSTYETITLADENAVATFEYTGVSGVHAYEFTPVVSGTVEFHVGYGSQMIYSTDAAYSEDSKTMLNKQKDSEGNFYFMEVTAGTTYYFTTSVLTDNMTMTVKYGTGDPGITITSNLSDGSTYSLGGQNLELVVDRTITVQNVTISYNGADGQLVAEDITGSEYYNTYSSSNYYMTFIFDALIDYMMDGGKLTYGDTFIITIKGIADANDPEKIYGTDGTYQISFVLGEPLAEVVGILPADGSEIYTYYPEGGDEGLVTFTFSDELDASIKDQVVVEVSYGDKEAGSYGLHHPDFTIEGNTVVVDLRGIMFPATVEGGRGSSTMQQTQVSLSIKGLMTTDGRGVHTNYPNAGTSAVLSFYHVVKEEINPSVFWYPDQSKTLVFGQDKEVTFYIDVPITYDGVNLKFWDARGTERNVTRDVEKAPLVWDDDMDMYSITVSLAGTNFFNQGIEISLINASLMNGDNMEFKTFYEGTMPSGIDNIVVGGTNPDEVVKVYSVDGVLVKEGAAGTVMQGLSKGLYIVNGVKVAVK